MVILLRKALRTMMENKKSYFACVWLICVGIIIFIAMNITVTGLGASRDQYYAEYRLADVFATVNRISKSEGDNLKQIPGIREASFRYVEDTRVLLPDSDKIIKLRLISNDPNATEPLNGILQTQDFYSKKDILLSQDFMDAHGLKIGDTIDVLAYGKIQTFRICGTAEGPEYVYKIEGMKEFLPDAGGFNIGYIQLDTMEAFLGKIDAYNNVSFALEEGYTYDDVKIMLEDTLQKYGLRAMIERKDQVSVNMLDNEINMIGTISKVIPLAFICMSMIILYLMIKRMIEQERGQIGTLKAFGYENKTLLWHYALIGTFVGAVGGLLGVVTGFFLSQFIAGILYTFFSLPYEKNKILLELLVMGVVIGASGGTLGAYFGARGVTKLIPAEAMRPVAPKESKGDLLRHLPFLRHFLSAGGNMALRNILRNRFRSVFIVLGITFAFGILGFVCSMPDMIDSMMVNQFTKVQRYDMKVSFQNPVPSEAAKNDVFQIKGVTQAEPLLEIPITLSMDNKTESFSLMGIQEDSQLYYIFDDAKKINLAPPKDSLILSDVLASDLNVKKGDVVTAKSPYLKEDVKLLVADVVTQSFGKGGYMEISSLARLLGEKPIATSLLINTNDLHGLKKELNEGKNVAFLTDIKQSQETYMEILGLTQYIFMVYTIIGIAVAVAIIYNTATISLSERSREFATLRVLGMQVGEVSEIMAFEYWILSFLGMALGVPFTMLMKYSLGNLIEISEFSFPTYTPPYAFLLAALGCIVAVIISNQSSKKRIQNFDMVDVLKERE